MDAVVSLARLSIDSRWRGTRQISDCAVDEVQFLRYRGRRIIEAPVTVAKSKPQRASSASGPKANS
jgi:hypothetical protein